MRFLKIFLLAFVIMIIAVSVVLAISYSQRLAIINYIAKAQLNAYQAKITCLDFHFAKRMTIIVDNLCLENTKANININNTTIHWQVSPTPKVTTVNIGVINVKGTEHLFTNSNQPSSTSNAQEQNFSQLLSQILSPYIEKITQLQLPAKINVEQLSYLPFLNKKTATPHLSTYLGTLKAVDNHLSFSLRSPTNNEFINAELTVNKESFVMALSSELSQLKHFANIHQLPVSTALQNELRVTGISGRVSTLVEYQADMVVIKSTTTDLVITSAQGINNSGAFTLFGALNFQTKLQLASNSKPTKNTRKAEKNDDLTLTFAEKNELTLEYSQQHLVTLLEVNNATEQVIALLKDNPLAQLTITLKNNTALKVNEKQVSLSSIELSAKSDERTHQIKLDDMVFNFPLNWDGGAYRFSINHFNIDSPLKLASLTPLTTEPVIAHLAGSLIKTDKQTTLTLSEHSSLVVKQIKIPNAQNNDSTKRPLPLLAIKALETKLKGNVWLQENNKLKLNLNIDSKALQLNVPKTIQLKTFNIVSHIQGSLDNININATTSADQVALGKIVISGSVQSPKVQLSANKLQLTDLLALNIKLPVEVALIDGVLDYNVAGQLTDLSHLTNNQISAAIAVTSLSGEIDGTWLQELNWRQHFKVLAGKVTTLPNTVKNLTIELIDTPSPITNFSTDIGLTYHESIAISANAIKADVLGGSFSIPKIQWPLKQSHSVDVQLTGIDLAQVLALDKKQGIVVTGNISGQLPILFDGKKYTIVNGKLYNINNGLIQVFNNPAVNELKKSNTQLQLAFDALQNLHYHQLSSEVSMTDDGYMLLETVIKGRNPDIDNDVNLNLNLSYDLLGLLESLSITENFEKNIIKGFNTH